LLSGDLLRNFSHGALILTESSQSIVETCHLYLTSLRQGLFRKEMQWGHGLPTHSFRGEHQTCPGRLWLLLGWTLLRASLVFQKDLNDCSLATEGKGKW
jgi:hypothetical protein